MFVLNNELLIGWHKKLQNIVGCWCRCVLHILKRHRLKTDFNRYFSGDPGILYDPIQHWTRPHIQDFIFVVIKYLSRSKYFIPTFVIITPINQNVFTSGKQSFCEFAELFLRKHCNLWKNRVKWNWSTLTAMCITRLSSLGLVQNTDRNVHHETEFISRATAKHWVRVRVEG